MLLTLLAFVVALGVLIAVHEYGHYRVAVACGVRVLRFSVGFGATLVRWQPRGSSTEFVIGAFPLGGYVKMLDEREGPVPADQRHLAFNNQPLTSRAAIVAAGPLINLLLAAALYCVVNWSGVEQPRAVLASPLQGSVAQRAGLSGGETVLAGGLDGDEVFHAHVVGGHCVCLRLFAFVCVCLRLLGCFGFYFLGDGFLLRGSAASIFSCI